MRCACSRLSNTSRASCARRTGLVARAVAIKPRSPDALSVLMAVQLGLDRAAEALAVCDKSFPINPSDLEHALQ